MEEILSSWTCNDLAIDEVETVSFRNKTVPVSVVEQAIDFDVYPNPSTGLFFVSVANNPLAQNIKIMNVQGQILQSVSIAENAGEQVLSLDITDEAAGMYLVQIVTDQEVAVKRLILK